jgi:hypothetical protein
LALLCLSLQAQAGDGATLRARHAALHAELSHNPFGRPLHVESSHDGGDHKGEIYAVVERPFERVRSSLRRAGAWCELLIVQANVKNCEAAGANLSLFVARRADDPIEQAHRLDFSYGVPAASMDYLHVELEAPEGPYDTTDYRIRVQAAPLDAGRTFLHLAYSYALHGAARLGMRIYLASSGRDKVGFSVVGRTPEGQPEYVRGVRGVVERNTMRYYLALEAYLAALDAPPAERVERRLRAFHAGLESYPRQLHELELGRYLDIKRADASRLLKSAIN